ncbi:hypothetical protein FHR55_002944 [Xanthomonas arboricola]
MTETVATGCRSPPSGRNGALGRRFHRSALERAGVGACHPWKMAAFPVRVRGRCGRFAVAPPD